MVWEVGYYFTLLKTVGFREFGPGEERYQSARKRKGENICFVKKVPILSLIRCGHCGGGIQQQEQALLGEGTCRKRITGKGIFLSSLLACLSMYSRRANRLPLWRVEKYHLLWEKIKQKRGGEGHTRPCSSFFRFPPCERGRETLFSLLPSASNITLLPPSAAAKGGGGGTLSLSILMVAMMTGERRKEEEERGNT